MKKGAIFWILPAIFLAVHGFQQTNRIVPHINNTTIQTSSNTIPSLITSSTFIQKTNDVQNLSNSITVQHNQVPIIQVPLTLSEQGTIQVLQTPAYQTFSKNFLQLTNNIQNLFNNNSFGALIFTMQWSVDSLSDSYARATGAISVVQESNAEFQAQKQKWNTFVGYLQRSSGICYMNLLQELSAAYLDLEKNNEHIFQKVFAHDSFFLHFIQTALGSCQQCIHDAFVTLQKTGYASASTQYFLKGDIQAQQASPLQQIQSFVDAVQKFCDTFFDQIQDSTVSDEQKKALKNNYVALFTQYQQSLAVTLYHFTLSLCNAYSAHASISVIPAKTTTSLSIPLDAMDVLFELCQSMVQSLPTGVFDSYASGQDALQALQQKMGQLHYYAALVLENNLNNQVAAQASNSSFLTTLQKLLKNTMEEYAAAAAYYKGLSATSLYQVTNTRFKLYSLLFSYVTALISQATTLSYEQATNYYNAAYQAALEGNMTEIAAFFLSNLHIVYVAQIQNFLSSYCENQTYQNYVKEQNVVDLFYTQNNALFQGIAVACQQAAQAYESIISSEQSFTQTFTLAQRQHLIDALTLTQNIASLGQTLFLGGTAENTQTLSADSLLYQKYYDPSSVLQGQMLYAKTLYQAQLCDTLLQKGENPYAPFTQLFTPGTVSLTALLQEHSAYVAMQSAAFALQVAGTSSYDAYNKQCYSSALCSLIYAYKVYQSLNQNEWAAYALQTIKTTLAAAGNITSVITSLINTQNPDDYQQACALAQALCIAQDQQGSILYQKATQGFAQLLERDTLLVPQLLKAFVLYRGLLIADYTKDTTIQNAYQQQIQTILTACVKKSASLLTTVQDTTLSVAAKADAFNQLQEFQSTLRQILFLQEYEQACFMQKKPFVGVAKKASSQGTTTTITFMGNITFVLPDISYLQALYLEQQAQSLQATINNVLQTNDYQTPLQPLFTKILNLYNQAKVLYRSLGMQDAVARIDQEATQAIGLSLLSLVVPTDTVQNSFPLSSVNQSQSINISNNSSTKINNTISTSSNPLNSWIHNVNIISKHQNQSLSLLSNRIVSQTVGSNNLLLNNNVEKQSTSQSQVSSSVNQNTDQPVYLLRSWQLNLTQKQQEIALLVQESQKQLPIGHTPAPALLAEQKLYDQLIAQTETLIAKKGIKNVQTSDITPLFLQWYTSILQQGGFIGLVLDFDQELQMITQQLAMMTTQGVTVQGKNITTRFALEQTENNGKKSIIITVSYLPIASIERFRGDIFCASYYYQNYQACFSKNMAPFIFQGVLYYPFAHDAYYTYGQNQLIRAYLVALQSYQKYITQQVQPLQNLSTQQKQSASLNNYNVLYQKIDQSYLSLFAIFSNVQSMQQVGNSVFSLQKQQSQLYQNAAETMRLFLLGKPYDSFYQSIIKKISSYYFYALLNVSDVTTQNQLVKNVIQLNEQAGDACTQLSQALPQIAGYPSPAPHNFPQTLTKKNNSSLKCVNQPPLYTFAPEQNLQWYYYELAQAYYSQALQVLQKYGTSSQQILQCKALMASVRAALQRIALCARNVFSVTAQQKGSNELFSVTAAANFVPILQAGLSSGANTLLQGEQNLMSGQQQQSSSNALAEYALLKKIYLDGMIYFSSVAEQSNQIVQMVDSIKNSQVSSQKTTFDSAYQTVLNGALSCAAFYQFPSLSAVVQLSKNKNPVVLPIMAISPKLPIDLSLMLTNNWQSMFLYGDTFLNFVEYVAYALLGDESNAFKNINSNNAQAFGDFVGQLTGIMRNVYAQIFMPNLFTKGDETTIQTSIDSALQQEGQQLLVNTTGYTG